MEIVYILAILAAFMLGAYVRKPFSFAKKETERQPEPEETAEGKRFRLQWENIMNAGNPNYKQQRLEDEK